MDIVDKLCKAAIRGSEIDPDDALKLFEEGAERPLRIMAAASEIRRHFTGDAIGLCRVIHTLPDVTPKSRRRGLPSEQRGQSGGLGSRKTEAIVEEAVKALHAGVDRVGVFEGGDGIKTIRDWTEIKRAIKGISELDMKVCAAPGRIGDKEARALKQAGLDRYHHGFDMSPFLSLGSGGVPDSDADVRAVRAARSAGLTVCCSCPIGMGEGIRTRIAMAVMMRNLNVDGIAIQIRKSVAAEAPAAPPLSPLEILVTIAVFRFLLPGREIRLCQGMNSGLRQLFPLGLLAGADSLQADQGPIAPVRDMSPELEMIVDLGLRPTRDPVPECSCARKASKGPRFRKSGK